MKLQNGLHGGYGIFEARKQERKKSTHKKKKKETEIVKIYTKQTIRNSKRSILRYSARRSIGKCSTVTALSH
jgi:hypothetical protein